MLVKHNNNSISDLTSAGQLAQGKMTLISSQTASGSASIEFTSGIDSTYPIYRFEFINCNPANDSVAFQFNLSTDSGSTYAVTKTTTTFRAYHSEGGVGGVLQYLTGQDLAQSTSFQNISDSDIGNGSDESCSGSLEIYNPSSTTFVKHFLATTNTYQSANYSMNNFTAGYGNTTSSIDAIKFQMSSGNFDGTIKLYGIKGD
jgi:hypothetical protein